MFNNDYLLVLFTLLIPLLGIGFMCVLACTSIARKAEDEIETMNLKKKIEDGAICPKEREGYEDKRS